MRGSVQTGTGRRGPGGSRRSRSGGIPAPVIHITALPVTNHSLTQSRTSSAVIALRPNPSKPPDPGRGRRSAPVGAGRGRRSSGRRLPCGGSPFRLHPPQRQLAQCGARPAQCGHDLGLGAGGMEVGDRFARRRVVAPTHVVTAVKGEVLDQMSEARPGERLVRPADAEEETPLTGPGRSANSTGTPFTTPDPVAASALRLISARPAGRAPRPPRRAGHADRRRRGPTERHSPGRRVPEVHGGIGALSGQPQCECEGALRLDSERARHVRGMQHRPCGSIPDLGEHRRLREDRGTGLTATGFHPAFQMVEGDQRSGVGSVWRLLERPQCEGVCGAIVAVPPGRQVDQGVTLPGKIVRKTAFSCR